VQEILFVNNSAENNLHKPSLADALHSNHLSALQRYKLKAAGEVSSLGLIQYELALLLLSNLAGALGYALRKTFYRGLFRRVGNGLILGRGIVLRYPGRIALGNRVAIDDYVLLDAAGAGEDGVTIGDDVIISRNCIVQGKVGTVVIGAGCDIGPNTVITSVGGIELADSVLIAANCYIGGGRYRSDDLNRPILEQGVYSQGTVRIGTGTWLGAGVIVLDGVTIGQGCIVGAGSVVTKDLPDFAVAVGVPAQVKQIRS
jgi:acetyltransferase-like isoleucine patch superfamily enzyme